MKTIIAILLALATSTRASDMWISKIQFEEAEVVLRVSKTMIGNGACDKYCWPEVKILKVFKNSSKQNFKKDSLLHIAVLNTSGRMPQGEFTLYLERYNESEKKPKKELMWRVLAGSVALGTSDLTALPPRTDCEKGTHPFTGLSGIPGCCSDTAVCD